MTELDMQVEAERCARAMWSEDRASQALGMTILSVGPGAAQVGMVVRDDMINGWAVCHGAYVAAVADSAFALACNSRGTVTVASGFDIDFVTSAEAGDYLVATATERVVRGRSGVYDVTVQRVVDSVDPVTIAEFRGRSRSLGRAIDG